jgi:hypothetical protein
LIIWLGGNLNSTPFSPGTFPASSAPSERLFYSSGNLVSAKRSSLNTKNVDMMMNLHENMDKVKLTSYDSKLLSEEDQEEEVQAVAGTFNKIFLV